MRAVSRRRADLLPAVCLLAAALALTPAAFGQSSLGIAGEQRLNTFQFHATHNSYQQLDEEDDLLSVAEQLDGDDVWHLELDLRWDLDLDDGQGDFVIWHTCTDTEGSDSLDSYLAQIDSTNKSREGLTFLYFDSGDLDCPFWYPDIVPKPAGWETRLADDLEAWFPGRVYSWSDFVADDHKWPSPQELLREGRNFVPILNDTGDGGAYFFAQTGANDVMLYNTSAETAPVNQSLLGDRSFARHYPPGNECSEGDDGWQWAIDNGYSFPSSNCSSKMSAALHPPLPTYVDVAPGGEQRGTWWRPYSGPSGVVSAVARIEAHETIQGASMIELQIEGGSYAAPDGRIDTTLRFTPRAGTGIVRLQ